MKERALLVMAFFLLAGCAGQQQMVADSDEYIEIENPGLTMSPGAPPTILVPRRYVDSGVPRGGEAIKQGIAALRDPGTAEVPRQVAAAPVAPVAVAPPAVMPVAPVQPAAGAAASVPAHMVAPVAAAPAVAQVQVLQRILAVDIGKSALAGRFSDQLKKASAGIVLDPAAASVALRYAPVNTRDERSVLSVKLQEDLGAGLLVYLSGGETVTPGAVLAAEVQEGQGGALVKRVEAVVPSFATNDSAARDAALAVALQQLARDVKTVAALVPWYGTVVTVEGERIYLNAGKESGILVGRQLHVYRPGKVLDKLGFAPGRKVGVAQVTGYVGTDGAFAITRQGEKALVGDLVGLE